MTVAHRICFELLICYSPFEKHGPFPVMFVTVTHRMYFDLLICYSPFEKHGQFPVMFVTVAHWTCFELLICYLPFEKHALCPVKTTLFKTLRNVLSTVRPSHFIKSISITHIGYALFVTSSVIMSLHVTLLK